MELRMFAGFVMGGFSKNFDGYLVFIFIIIYLYRK